MTTNIADITRAITDIFDEYVTEIVQEVSKATEEVAKESVKELKDASPKQTGNYAEGWTYQKESGGRTKPAVYTIHNKTFPQMTYWLERGHAKKGGGRVRAIRHIEPIRDKAEERLHEKVLEAIGRVTG